MKRFLSLGVGFAAFLTLPLHAQQAERATTTPQTRASSRVASLVEAMNGGDPVEIARFVAANYESDHDQWTRYWASLHYEVGPLAFHSAEAEPSRGGERQILWYHGQTTRAWVGLRLTLEPDEPFRIMAGGVRRSPRPRSVAARSPLTLAQIPDTLNAVLRASTDQGYFSGAVLVAKDGEVVFESAYGHADKSRGVRNTTETRFSLASMTKMFTGVAIAQLAERGLLSFDDPIGKHIPEYPAPMSELVTIHHLLTHSSGIEFDDDPTYMASLVATRSVRDLLKAQLAHVDRRGGLESFALPDGFDYTNEGVDLLGVIIENVSGRSWGQVLRDEVFYPAGMTNTGSDLLEDDPLLARRYTLRGATAEDLAGGDRPEFQSGNEWLIRPAGTGFSTTRDMFRFLEAVRSHRLLGSDMADLVTSPLIEEPTPPGLGFQRSYGYTFRVRESAEGGRAVGHNGGAPGIGTSGYFYPDTGFTIVVLSNFEGEWWLTPLIEELVGAM